MALAPVDIKVTVKGKGEIEKLASKMNGLESNITKVNKKLPKAENNIRSVGKASKAASVGVNKLTNAVKGLAIGYTAIQALKFTFFKTAELETQRKSLEVLTGDLEIAKNVIKELQDFGAVTPFTSTELIETAKRLKAFGTETEDLVITTKRLGDVAGATGADLGGIATAFGQITAKGRLQGEELLQLQERGINLQDELQEMYGLTGDEFRKALEKGQISAEAVDLALRNLTETGGKYANGAIAQSDTLNGRLSTLQDNIGRLAQNIGKQLAPVFTWVINKSIEAINYINQLFNQANKIQGYGIDAKTRNSLFQQAEEAAKQIALKRGGGLLDPAVFNQIKQETFSDLLEEYGVRNGKVEVIISPVIDTSAPEIPELLGLGDPSGKGSAIAKNSPKEREKSIKELLGVDWDEVLGIKVAERQLEITQQQSEALKAGNTVLYENLEAARQYVRPLLEVEALQVGIERSQNKLLELTADGTDAEKLKANIFKLQNQLLERQVSLQSETARDTNQSLVDDLQAANAFADKVVGLKTVNEELTNSQQLLADSYSAITNNLTSGIQGLIKGTQDWNDVLGDVLSNLSSILLNFAFKSLGAGIGIPGFAEGGRPVPGGLSIVGERGPELFVPDTPGTILTNDQAFDVARGAMGRGGSTDSDPLSGDSSSVSGGGSTSVSNAFAQNRSYITNTSQRSQQSETNQALQETIMQSSNGSAGKIQFETISIGGMDVVTREEAIKIGQDSAEQTRTKIFSDIKNRPAIRRQMGLA